jgi:hypothetical protein
MGAAPSRTEPPRDLFTPRRGAVFGAGIVACVVAVIAEFVRGEGSLVDAAALLVGYVALFGGGNVVYERGSQFQRYARKVEAESWTVRIATAARQHTRIAWTVAVSLVVVLGAGVYQTWLYTSAAAQHVGRAVGRGAHTDQAAVAGAAVTVDEQSGAYPWVERSGQPPEAHDRQVGDVGVDQVEPDFVYRPRRLKGWHVPSVLGGERAGRVSGERLPG